MLIIAMSEDSKFFAADFVFKLVTLAVVVSATELKCISVLKGLLMAAFEPSNVVAVNIQPDLSNVHVENDKAVFFFYAIISFKLLLRACVRLSVWIF